MVRSLANTQPGVRLGHVIPFRLAVLLRCVSLQSPGHLASLAPGALGGAPLQPWSLASGPQGLPTGEGPEVCGAEEGHRGRVCWVRRPSRWCHGKGWPPL